MADTPLTTRALERLRGIIAGNGLDAGAVKVLKTDEQSYTLTAELTMSARWELELAKPAELKQYEARTVPNTENLHSMAQGRPFPREWWGAVLDELKANDVGAGTGWGADGLNVTLPAFTELYNVTELCRSCAGDKQVNCATCDGHGVEWCWHCDRTGREPGGNGQACTVCRGEQKAECRTCNGRRLVVCPTCKGRGSKQTIYALRFTASTRFGWVGGNDLPTPLRRSIDRAGLAKLANGHAVIDKLPMPEEVNPLAPAIRFTATLPFASATFDIGGRPFMAELLGNRTAILEMKPFLDQIAADALANATLNQLRLFREAQAIAARRGSVADFMRGYPVGLSRDMADKVFQVARNSLGDILAKPRQQAVLVAALAAVLVSVLYFYGPLRTLVFSTGLFEPRTYDVFFPIITAILFLAGLQWWSNRQLAARLGDNARAPFLSWAALAGTVLIIILHYVIMLTSPEPPSWYYMDKLRFTSWIDSFGRPEQ